MKAIGIMSGTSLDGVDVVLCEIEGYDEKTKVQELAFQTYPFDEKLLRKLQKILMDKTVDLATICSLNFELGHFFAKCCLNLCEQFGIQTNELAFIASHGQTIYHISTESANFQKSTLQLGEAAIISEQCGCTVISNFRAKDMAVGGQGAPLVPYSEYILYKSTTKSYGLQNIGGIGNLTIIPKNASLDDVIAFDTGPGNMMINAATKYLYHLDYDDNGTIASKGSLIVELQQELMHHDYLQLAPPKSTGRELFGDDYTLHLIEKYCDYKKEDIIATLTWYTAYCIYFSYENYVKPITKIDDLIVSGGGAHNATLIHWLKVFFEQTKVYSQEDLNQSSDSKEAVAFVILGNQTLHQRPANVPYVTGATKNVVLGQITYP